MQQKKKKQHYVWKQHLKAWSDSNEKIYSLIKINKKVAQPNLIGVAQEKFYYELEEFTLEEEIILEEFIKNWSSTETTEINLHYFHCFTSYSKIKRESKNKIFHPTIQEKFNSQLELLKCNGMENFHCNYENYGSKLISVKKFEDLFFLNDDNDLHFTMAFLCLQYTRTKKMRNALDFKFQNHDYLIPKYWNIIAFIMASSITTSLVYFNKLKFIYYENLTEIDFIISDQPVINTLKEEKDEKGHVKEIKFYYPINPKVAIAIYYKQDGDKFEKVIIEEQQVLEFNQLIFENSEDFLFATSSKQLEEYKNCL